jgi:peptide/nickel transport system permease protein
LSFSLGLLLGAIAGYYGGIVDSIIMRIMDMLLCIPSILLALVIVAALGTSIPNLLLAITIGNAPSFARMIRASIITVANQEYVDAARICGTRDSRIVLHHIIPNTMGPIIVQATMSVAGCITATAGLSFVGMGIQAPRPEWGAMLSSGRDYMRYYPYLVIIPGMFIVVTALAINLFGDGLRDAMDPRLKD